MFVQCCSKLFDLYAGITVTAEMFYASYYYDGGFLLFHTYSMVTISSDGPPRLVSLYDTYRILINFYSASSQMVEVDQLRFWEWRASIHFKQ